MKPNMPSRFKKSFASMFQGFHTARVDEATGVRYLYDEYVAYFETGRVEISPHWDGEPHARHSQRYMSQVAVYLAKDADCPVLWTPDGEKIAKAWVYDNPSVFVDFRFGVALFGSGGYPHKWRNKIVYNGPNAMPHALKPIVCHIPDKKLLNERTDAALSLSLLDRAAWKTAGSRPAACEKGYPRMMLDSFWKHPSEMTYKQDVAWALATMSEEGIRERVKEFAYHVREYPHLLIEKPSKGVAK